MKQKSTISLFKIFLIAVLISPVTLFGQLGSLSNCHWLNPNPTAGDEETYQVTWSALGSGSGGASITLSAPSGADANGWDLSTFTVKLTDLSGTWAQSKDASGNVVLTYSDFIADGNFFQFEINATHDGTSSSLNSNISNTSPGNSPCSNEIFYQNPQPITLSSFDVIREDAVAKLQWVTESETGSSHFEIEASADGQVFRKIATVASKADEQGNSIEALHYSYTDNFAATRAKVVYYRLKQVDLNGDNSYTDIRRADFEGVKIPYVISPNPVQVGNQISVNGDFFTQVELYNAIGQSVYAQSYNTEVSSATIPTQELSPGLYNVVIDGTSKISIMVQ